MTRWGIIGCGFIARRMAKVLNKLEDSKLVAVAAREMERAGEFANEFGAARAFDSYAELAACPEVDAVYVATIHPTHAQAIRTCLRAGKPVLCEKPLAMNAAEAEALFAEAKKSGVLLMEAIWTRFLPAWRAIRTAVEKGEIGELLAVEADFTGVVPFDPQSRLYNVEKGGGGLLDVGVYPIHMALFLLGETWDGLHAAGRLSPTGTDSYAAVTLHYPRGQVAILTSGCDMCGGLDARLFGTKGSIHVPFMFRADAYTLQRQDGTQQTFSYPIDDGFEYQVMAFQESLRCGETENDIASHAATIAVLRAVDEAFAQITAQNTRIV